MTNQHTIKTHLPMHGFTLIEMAISLVILGLLTTIFISPLGIQRDIQHRSSTHRQLLEIKEALMGFATINGYLPCPDSKALPDGIEDNRDATTGSCPQDEGILPWNTLAISATDAWQHYFAYRVDADFSNQLTPIHIGLGEANSGITVYSRDAQGNTINLISGNSRPAAIVLSYGENGLGATNTNQNTETNQQAAATTVDEIENTDHDVTFASKPPAADGFDDQLIWLSPKVLINRMLTAERLP